MKFSIEKTKLLQGLNMVRQAVAQKTTNPVFKTVLIMASKDGGLTLRATNGILEITYALPLEVEEEGSCCVDSLVIDALQNFAEGEIKFFLKFDESPTEVNRELRLGGKLTISQGRRRHQPVYMPHWEFPEKKEITNYGEVNPQSLLRAFLRTHVATSSLADRPILQGFHINPHLGFIITGDGSRVALWEGFEVPGNITTPQARIVASVLGYVNQLGENDKFEVGFGQWSGFRTAQWEIIFNSLAGEFPEKARTATKDAYGATPKLRLIIPKATLKNVLEMCRVYSDYAYNLGRGNQVVLSRKGDEVVFSMKVPEVVEMEEPVECQAEGEANFEIWLHPVNLLEAVSGVVSDTVELRFFSPKLPFLLLDSETPNFIYLQAPMAKKEDTRKNKPKPQTTVTEVQHHRETSDMETARTSDF